MNSVVAALAIAAAVGAESLPARPGDDGPFLDPDASAAEIIEACRTMVPSKVEIKGHINRRSRRGTTIAAYRFDLKRDGRIVELAVEDSDGKPVELEKGGRLLDTDITWSDLSLDYLWWKDVSFDRERESESAQGVLCRVLLLRNGVREVRVWVDRRSGAMLQAEESAEGRVVRRLFCTSLKKFGGRWAPKNIEVGPPGAKYRTKIVVEEVI